MSRPRIVGVVALVLMILSIGYFIGFATYVPLQRARATLLLSRERDAENARLAAYVDQPAPPIVSETLDGQRWSLADQRGKVVLVFVWSILCQDCVAAIPILNRLYSTYDGREDFVLVGVHGFPERDVISSYCSAKGIPWPQLYERSDVLPNGFLDTMGIKRTPSICLIDREGTVRAIHVGLGPIEGEVQGLLKSRAAN